MKILASVLIFVTIVSFSCTDRDDNLEGVQIRVENTTQTTFTEVRIDSLVFSDLQPDDLAFYQQYDSLELPQTIELLGDSLDLIVAVDTAFVIDSLQLHLFTYRITGLTEATEAEVEVLKD
jgi:hypothetical protein